MLDKVMAYTLDRLSRRIKNYNLFMACSHLFYYFRSKANKRKYYAK